MNSAEITQLLKQSGEGDEDATRRLYQEIYRTLHLLARQQRSRWVGDDTLNATALVNEAFLKLAASEANSWTSRGHYFAVAARAMRQILVDKARARSSAKRGANAGHLSLDELIETAPEGQNTSDEDILTLHDLLEQLEQIHPRQARMIECRFFGGLSLEETAMALDISITTVRRDWALARIWLHQALNDGQTP